MATAQPGEEASRLLRCRQPGKHTTTKATRTRGSMAEAARRPFAGSQCGHTRAKDQDPRHNATPSERDGRIRGVVQWFSVRAVVDGWRCAAKACWSAAYDRARACLSGKPPFGQPDVCPSPARPLAVSDSCAFLVMASSLPLSSYIAYAPGFFTASEHDAQRNMKTLLAHKFQMFDSVSMVAARDGHLRQGSYDAARCVKSCCKPVSVSVPVPDPGK